MLLLQTSRFAPTFSRLRRITVIYLIYVIVRTQGDTAGVDFRIRAVTVCRLSEL
jgi:hypothetical protein